MKSNVKIGTGQQKMSLFNLSQTNNTTATWGHFQPIFSREMKKDDSISISEFDVIRLAPMPQPTFAKSVSYKKFGMFVPFEDVYKPFANLLSQQPYAPAEGERYIPTKVPYIKVQDLTLMVISMFGNFELFNNVNRGQVPMSLEQELNAETLRSKLQQIFIEPWIDNITDDQLIVNIPSENSPESFAPSDYDFAWRVTNGVYDGSYVCCRLNRYGRNIRKVLLGLGYQLDLTNDTDVSMLPIFCYYKAYFDIFFPQRNITWTDTNCYTILNIATQKNLVNMSAMFTQHTNIFKDFILELANTYYTYNPDYFSAQLGSNSLEKSYSYLESYDNSIDDGDVSSVNDTPPIVPYASSGGVGTGITAMQVWLAEKMTKYVNKNTIVGGKIYEWLAAHGLGRYIDDHRTNFLGAFETPVQVFDVDCNTMQEDSPLGNYAGKGVGSNRDKLSEFNYKADCFGQLIIMGAIVPDVGYFQGTNPMLHHLQPLEYYHGEFDSLGMVSTYKGNMVSQSFVTTNPDRPNASSPFGLIPRYMEYKCQPLNIINGDISLRSRMAGLLGYTLDRYLATDELTTFGVGGTPETPHYYCEEAKTTDNISNSINWRFCNRFPWMGNFDRMFYNANIEKDISGTAAHYVVSPYADDNFIIHHYFDAKLSSLMLPVSHSYLTDAESDSAINVTKE